jgi:hypothetical protein
MQLAKHHTEGELLERLSFALDFKANDIWINI